VPSGNLGQITSTNNFNNNNDNASSPNTGTGLPRQIQFMLSLPVLVGTRSIAPTQHWTIAGFGGGLCGRPMTIGRENRMKSQPGYLVWPTVFLVAGPSVSGHIGNDSGGAETSVCRHRSPGTVFDPHLDPGRPKHCTPANLAGLGVAPGHLTPQGYKLMTLLGSYTGSTSLTLGLLSLYWLRGREPSPISWRTRNPAPAGDRQGPGGRDGAGVWHANPNRK